MPRKGLYVRKLSFAKMYDQHARFWFIHVFIVQEHEVDAMYPLQSGRLPSNNVQHIIFITRAKVSHMEMIAENVYG